MSAVRQQPMDLGYVGLSMTAEDFFAIGETFDRLQLIDGIVVMLPRPSPRHQSVIRLVQRQLETYMDAHPGAMYFPEVDLQLSPRKVYSPDLVCYRPGRLTGLPERMTLPPDLVIGILSPSNKAFDLTKQRDDYEEFGVGEYWCYDPADGRFRQYRRDGTLLVETPVTGDAVQSAGLPGFVLDLRPLRHSA